MPEPSDAAVDARSVASWRKRLQEFIALARYSYATHEKLSTKAGRTRETIANAAETDLKLVRLMSGDEALEGAVFIGTALITESVGFTKLAKDPDGRGLVSEFADQLVELLSHKTEDVATASAALMSTIAAAADGEAPDDAAGQLLELLHQRGVIGEASEAMRTLMKRVWNDGSRRNEDDAVLEDSVQLLAAVGRLGLDIAKKVPALGAAEVADHFTSCCMALHYVASQSLNSIPSPTAEDPKASEVDTESLQNAYEALCDCVVDALLEFPAIFALPQAPNVAAAVGSTTADCVRFAMRVEFQECHETTVLLLKAVATASSTWPAAVIDAACGDAAIPLAVQVALDCARSGSTLTAKERAWSLLAALLDSSAVLVWVAALNKGILGLVVPLMDQLGKLNAVQAWGLRTDLAMCARGLLTQQWSQAQRGRVAARLQWSTVSRFCATCLSLAAVEPRGTDGSGKAHLLKDAVNALLAVDADEASASRSA